MIKLFLRGLALLLVLMTLLPLAMGCAPDVENPGENTDPGNTIEPDAYGFVPTVRFAVASDVHVRGTDPDDYNSRNMLAAYFETAYKYSASQPYNKLDGIFVVGDYTQNGNASEKEGEHEMQDFFECAKENTKAGTFFKAVLGNHEFYFTRYNDGTCSDSRYSDTSVENTVANHLKYSGDKALDEHVVINGYHFIFLSMDKYDKNNGIYYSDAKLDWLKEELKKASAADETGLKPIFVFEHIGPSGAVIGTADKKLDAILKEYSQVVNFSGHSHTTLTDPRTINQINYTALNTGSLAYLGIPIVGHPKYGSTGTAATDSYGSWDVGDLEDDTRTGGMYYLIEMDANNVMRVRIYDIFSNEFYGEPILVTGIGNPKEFNMTNKRANQSTEPVFDTNAAVQSVFVGSTTALFQIPHTTGGDPAQNYFCDIAENNVAKQRIYRLTGLHFGSSRPDTVALPISDLKANTKYTVRVFPTNVWGKVGEPLSFTFTTATSDTVAPTILSTTFESNGSAKNALTGEKLTTVGAPRTVFDEDLQQNVAIFGGKDAFTFDMEPYYELMKTGFTFEAYVYFSSKPSSGYVDAVSNQHYGGFGFEYTSKGQLIFYCNVNGSYQKPSASISTGEWVHVVGTFDGSATRIYINGTVKNTVLLKGTFSRPVSYSQYLAIGGDSQAGGNVSNFFTGKIASVNLYSDVLTAEQISALYNSYK